MIRKVWRIKQNNRGGWKPVLEKPEESKDSLLQWQKENRSPSKEILT